MEEAHYLSRKEAAAYLSGRGFRTSPLTLAKLVTVGGGPIYYRFGHRAVYKSQDLDAWAKTKLSAPMTSSSQAA